MSIRWSIALAALSLLGCADHPLQTVPPSTVQQSSQYFPQTLEKDIDILFVIDNSGSMKEEQDNLAKNFPRLVDALRNPKLGPDGSGKPCGAGNTSGCKIPNVRIGVVSTDLGVPVAGIDGCSGAGDGARLLSQPRGGCVGPSDPYISYVDGKTNVDAPAIADPIERVKQAFSCIARLGTDGCGYEHPLEAARRALDGKTNPGFLRTNALLAVVFITDEDDCSAQKPALLFDPKQLDAYGFGCFEHGVRCDINDSSKPGPRKDCRPYDDPDASKQLLFPVTSYVSYFKGLKPPGRVVLSAIAGDTDRVQVGMDGGKPFLAWTSCQGKSADKAAPAIRLKAAVDGFGGQGHFSTICTDNFGPALERIGELIVANLGGQCISAPPLTGGGGLACHAGDLLGALPGGLERRCEAGCLADIDCIVELTSPGESPRLIPACEPAKFDDPTDTDCGARCPCWRVVARPGDCKPELQGSPYGLEVLRRDKAQPGTGASVRCATTPERWGSAALASMPQCN